MNFAIKHASLDTDRSRLRQGHERFRPVSILDVQQEEHLVWGVNRPPNMQDFQTGRGAPSGIPVQNVLPFVDVLHSITNQQHHLDRDRLSRTVDS